MSFYVNTVAGRKVSYSAVASAAKRIGALVTERHRKMCRAAGLDPSLLGIHPHNAMCALHYGKPWPEVDYKICKRLYWEMKQGRAFIGSRVLSDLYARSRTVFDWELGAQFEMALQS